VSEAAQPWPPRPVTLAGRHATLRPLAASDAPALAEAVRDGALHALWYTAVPGPEDVERWIAQALSLRAAGSAFPFAVLDATGTLVGSTRYMNIDSAHRRLEIGTTFYARRVQRSALNTECKRMLLAHAFETLDAIGVEFRTHFFNHQSRRAIERLGAKLDGVLRNHQRMPDGTLRDTCVYSILPHEWPTVRRHLDFQLERPPPGPDDTACTGPT
jgi:RimJ/RimL family protein N-acetyltransferase